MFSQSIPPRVPCIHTIIIYCIMLLQVCGGEYMFLSKRGQLFTPTTTNTYGKIKIYVSNHCSHKKHCGAALTTTRVMLSGRVLIVIFPPRTALLILVWPDDSLWAPSSAVDSACWGVIMPYQSSAENHAVIPFCFHQWWNDMNLAWKCNGFKSSKAENTAFTKWDASFKVLRNRMMFAVCGLVLCQSAKWEITFCF